MTPNNYYGNRQGNRGGYGTNGRQNADRDYNAARSAAEPYQDAEPKLLPEQFVDLAMQVMAGYPAQMNKTRSAAGFSLPPARFEIS